MSSKTYTYEFPSSIRGHHVYKRVWTPVFGEVLKCSIEDDNEEDTYAISVVKSGKIIGHVPKEDAKVFYYFLKHGNRITCRVVGHRFRGKGLEVIKGFDSRFNL